MIVTQVWLTSEAPQAPAFATGLYIAFINPGVAVGSLVGGWFIAARGYRAACCVGPCLPHWRRSRSPPGCGCNGRLRLRCVNHRHHLPKHRAFRIGQFVDQRKVVAVAIGQQLDVEAARRAGVIIGLRLVLNPWVSRWPTSSNICGACSFAGSKTAG